MPINPNPDMTRLLVGERVFRHSPFTLVDIGARGGIKGQWTTFLPDLRVIGFEPHPEEFRDRSRRPQTRIVDTLPGASVMFHDGLLHRGAVTGGDQCKVSSEFTIFVPELRKHH